MNESLTSTLACTFNSQHAMLELLSKLHMAVIKQDQHKALKLINEQLGVELKQHTLCNSMAWLFRCCQAQAMLQPKCVENMLPEFHSWKWWC